MTETGTESRLVTWSVPECPFTIEYSPRVLDDIRLGVVDAFFSLPRGGAEIGGILLGKHESGRLVISDYVVLDCEHAFGPSFTLSQNDEAKLRELLAGARGHVAGWYHSHTRSDISLSDADLDIHRRFFPEPWQVALVMKPHTFQPTRIGFFFREADGSVRARAAYGEAVLEPLPMRPMPSGDVPSDLPPRGEALRSASGRIGTGAANGTGTIDVPATTEAAPAAAAPAPVTPQPGSQPDPDQNPKPPKFLTAQPPPSRPWLAVIGIGILLGMIGGAFLTRQVWLPRVTTAIRTAPVVPAPAMTVAVPPPYLGLNTIDHEGQLQIQWDRNSRAVRLGLNAILEITDGGVPAAIPLDAGHLQTGAFAYGRQGERVDVRLIVQQPDGGQVREATSFLGKLPERQPAPVDPLVLKQRDELAKQAAKLQKALNSQAARTKKLEKDLASVRREVLRQQRNRLANQVPDINK